MVYLFCVLDFGIFPRISLHRRSGSTSMTCFQWSGSLWLDVLSTFCCNDIPYCYKGLLSWWDGAIVECHSFASCAIWLSVMTVSLSLSLSQALLSAFMTLYPRLYITIRYCSPQVIAHETFQRPLTHLRGAPAVLRNPNPTQSATIIPSNFDDLSL